MRRSHSIFATSALLSLALFNACGGSADSALESPGGYGGSGGGSTTGGFSPSTGGLGSPSTGGLSNGGAATSGGSGAGDSSTGEGGAGAEGGGGMKGTTGCVGGTAGPGVGGNGGKPGKGAADGGAAGQIGTGGDGAAGGAVCPSEAPESKSSRSGPIDCDYAANACPPLPPQEDMPCDANSECTYGEQSCACEKGGWHCTPPTPKP